MHEYSAAAYNQAAFWPIVKRMDSNIIIALVAIIIIGVIIWFVIKSVNDVTNKLNPLKWFKQDDDKKTANV